MVLSNLRKFLLANSPNACPTARASPLGVMIATANSLGTKVSIVDNNVPDGSARPPTLNIFSTAGMNSSKTK